MKQILEFDPKTAKGKFELSQFTFGEGMTAEEKEVFPKCNIYVEQQSDDSEKFALTLCHFCAIHDVEDEESDSALGTFEDCILQSDLPDLSLKFSDMTKFQQNLSVQRVREAMVQLMVYQFGHFTVSRPSDLDSISGRNPFQVELKCFDYTGSMVVYEPMKRSLGLHDNLAGGIITTSFIVDHSAKRFM